jgi:signal transduction histidine kinase
MAWLSRLAIQLDAKSKEALRQAAFEENVRLALWRMDSALTGLIGRENARPTFPNEVFLDEQIPGDYDRAEAPAAPSTAGRQPLHFQIGPDGVLMPALAGKRGDPAGELGTSEGLARIARLREMVTRTALLESIEFTTQIRTVQKVKRPAAPTAPIVVALAAPTPEPPPAPPPEPTPPQIAQANAPPRMNTANVGKSNAVSSLQMRANQAVQQSMNYNEQAARQMLFERNMENNVFAAQQAEPPPAPPPPDNRIDLATALEARPAESRPGFNWVTQTTSEETRLELMHPVWLDDELFLVRRVTVGSREYLQGCWLDWSNMRSMLLKLVDDLLPGAELQPLHRAPTADRSRLLAAIPAVLTPGPLPAEAAEGSSVLRASLAIGWAAMLVAVVAVGLVLERAVELSRRRGAFVSAVTHELRTPLTTFRMYTEMLAEGMIADEEKRRKYIASLHGESERMSHLVENVLAYAQLENNRGGAERIQAVPLAEIVDRIAPHLAERAARSGMELVVEPAAGALEQTVRADLSAVERILFNLVDNAGKYARGAADRRIHLTIRASAGPAELCVRDHGPGVPDDLRKILFDPFSKSAQDAANSAPGVGLGLSISRRLARQMSGDLKLDEAVRDGACFALTLPLA